MLKAAQIPSGGASGDLRFTVDLDQPRRTSAKGNLKGEALDLTLLLDRPVKIERIDLEADGTSLRIREAKVNWADQIIRLQGGAKYGTGGPVVDAQLESPGVVVDALLRKVGEEKPRK